MFGGYLSYLGKILELFLEEIQDMFGGYVSYLWRKHKICLEDISSI
jgi:hypothetical protein